MANIDAQLNDVEAWGGESVMLPPGEYQLAVKEADVEQKERGDKIVNQLVLGYEVISGAFSGKRIKAWFTLDFTKDTPRKRLKSLVNACGIALSGNGSFDTAQLIGCKINADIVHESYEGKPDPILGGPPVQRTAVRVVNERAFGSVAAAPVGAPSAPPNSGARLGASLPGLTKA